MLSTVLYEHASASVRAVNMFLRGLQSRKDALTFHICYFFIKVTESGYIELLWSANLSKSFSQLIVSILIFSQYFFFNRFSPVGFPHVAYIVIH